MFLFGCNNHKQEEKFFIGFSQCIASDHWRRTMLEEMKMELSLHPSAEFLYMDADGNSNRQVKQVREMLKKNIDLLIISPNEAHPLAAVVEEAYNMGIPVILIDRKTSSPHYTAYVGADNYQIGKMAADYIANALLKRKGSVGEVMGLPGSSPAIERSKGFIDQIKKYPEIQVKFQFYGDWLKEQAENQLRSHQSKLKGTDIIFAHNDVMASGSWNVLKELDLQKETKVIGVDALPGARAGLELVGNKTLTASLLYPTGGKEAISTAFAILSNKPFQKENVLQTVVIDSTNVELMKMQWAKFSSQQKDIERQKGLLEDQLEIYNNQRLVLNVIVITLVLVVVFGGLAFHSLLENRKINKRLELKNAEIIDQKNQLIEMSAKAEQATETKLNFFTNISHEFRTPLTLIISPLEDLLKDPKVNQLSGNNLRMINKNVFRLLKLVNQLIDYRKIEHDKFEIRAAAGNLVQFLTELLEHFRHLANKRNIDLRLIGGGKEMMAWFDADILDKVMFNLLSNALKFTADNGRIYVHLSSTAEQFIISIEDNGIGMDETALQNIFEEFYQVGSGQSRGSGLGLSLSKELITLHKGTIDVESEKWKGTTFTVKLPLNNAGLAKPEDSRYQDKNSRLYDQVKIYTTDLEENLKTTKDQTFNPLKEQTMLIVEDNPDLLQYLSEKFEHDYEVFSASTLHSGILEAYEKIPDVIISDVVLPDGSGTDLANKLKTDFRTSHIPIILLTAKGSIEQQINGVQSMADLYLTKPFNFDYLHANVENLLRNRGILKEHYTSDISAGAKKTTASLLDKKFLNEFSGIVEHNLSNEDFSVEDLCRSIGISRIQLYRKVKALLNCSISDYILNRRLKKAKYYLSNEDHTIAEVSYMVGISSATYFSTVFKARYGTTPSEFRKAMVKNGN
ncbi:helix-turn-helix domain-containing protein [Pedobacter chinensis]|uniref:histidine kinase n=2 Tax=Pedobacter chinensis TaxID=2282421 RepID=A0A369PNN9_9SPHI|nr:helix-turn-helix domain-containing protein [Pedobacter chinensis]